MCWLLFMYPVPPCFSLCALHITTIQLLGMVLFNPCYAKQSNMPRPLLVFRQSDYLIQVVDTNSNTEWQAVQIQISWLLQKPTDLDLHCLQRQGIYPVSAGQGLNAIKNWVAVSENVPSDMCTKRRFRSAYAFAQSQQKFYLAHLR